MEYLYGLLKYRTNNVGDEIQSLAAKQFLPRVDVYLDREQLHKVKSDKKIKLIMNGWFIHNPSNWPPSLDIEPLFVSFHIAESAAEKLTSPESIKYLRKYEPIGCRDLYTKNLLEKKGVDAYFSGCLTLTLHRTIRKRSEEVLIVGLDKKITECLPNHLAKKAVFINHNFYPPVTKEAIGFFRTKLGRFRSFAKRLKLDLISKIVLRNLIEDFLSRMVENKRRFEKAEKLLERYANARFVITSLFHCALPCLAFNTPVIFIPDDLKNPRFEGLLKYLNSYSYDEFQKKCHKINWRKLAESPGNVGELQRKLIKICKNFVSSGRK